jgi:hypothetical protein
MQKYLELLCSAESVPRTISVGTVSGPFLEYDPFRVGLLVSPNNANRFTLSTDKTVVDGSGINFLLNTPPRMFLFPFDGTWIYKNLYAIASPAGFICQVFTLISKVSLDEWLSLYQQMTTKGLRMPNAPLVR